MKKTKFTPMVSLVASLAAGVETDVIIDDNGVMYTPFANVDALGLSAKGTATASSASNTVPAKKASKDVEADEPEANTAEGQYTEDELIAMDAITELLPMCKKLGIKVPEEGKNTNKKLRALILEHQASGAATPAKKAAKDEEEDEEEKPTAKSGRGAAKPAGNPHLKTVEEILAKVDKGKLSGEEGEEELLELTDSKEVKKAVRKAYQNFLDDESLDISDVAKDIANLLNDEEEEPAAKPAGRGAAKAKIITPDDGYAENLEVGNRVSVYWEDEAGWFEGEVAAISKKGVVSIDYDDESEGDLDDDNTTKVKILS